MGRQHLEGSHGGVGGAYGEDPYGPCVDRTAGTWACQLAVGRCRRTCSRHQGGHRDEGAKLVHGGGGGQGTQQGQEALADVGDKIYDDDLNCLFLVQHEIC